MIYELIAPVNESYTATEQILTNRGIPLQNINHYLSVSEEDNLSPLLLNNIEQAAQMLIKHLDEEGVIKVQVDSDCDGYTSCAVLLNYIHARFPSLVDKFVYSFHDNKTHGIDMDSIPENTTLIIVPDASSNEYEKHKQLSERGIDVLILDHHQSDKTSEYACVVNNQLCDYPTKSLSGVGIVYKFCQYLDSLFGDNKADDFLDLVAVGLTGDMMDMRDFETHYLTQKGLNQLRNPFVKGMAEKNKRQIGDVLSPIKAAFYIVPLVNSITRVGSLDEKKLLFESMLDWKAFNLIPSNKRGHAPGEEETVIDQCLRTCTNVKNRQGKSQDAATEIVKAKIEEENLLDHKVIIVKITNPTFDRGITGLIANKVMSEFCRPVALLIKGTNEDGEVTWSGSARGYEKSKLTDFRQLVRDSGLAYLAEGHPNAFGIGFTDENLNKFIEYSDEKLKDIEFALTYKVDYIYNPQTMRAKDITDIGGLKSLWGQNMNEPLVVIENISVTKDMLHLMSRDKNPTLKIVLPNGVSLIKFKSSEEEFDTLFSESGCVVITAIGRCEQNVYFGKVTPQLIIENYEIVTKQDYYF